MDILYCIVKILIGNNAEFKKKKEMKKRLHMKHIVSRCE